ncbi:MAG: hypothetical protein KDA29_06975 [Phycisphaerales bacterium]|nr:hypothetical protein [Phycisphaerales bacterium]
MGYSATRFKGCLIQLIAVGAVFIALFIWARAIYFPWWLRWPQGQHVDPQEREPSWFVYATRLKDPTQSFVNADGDLVQLPNRIILVSSSEREDTSPVGDVRLGDGVISIPFEALTYDLTGIDLKQFETEFNHAYATDSPEYDKAVIYIDRLKDHSGLPTYVMAHLKRRTAVRCVWSVDQDGKAIPLTIAFTHDRAGYRYRESITREEALYKGLLLPVD